MTAAFPRVAPLAESGLLITFGDALSAVLSRRIAALTETLLALALPGVVDLVPSYTTVTLLLDPERADPDAIVATVHDRWAATAAATAAATDVAPSRRVTIPVAYGNDHGPDLADVARHTGLSPEDVIRRHSEAVYLVAALGFAPGFAFLLGLPPELATPRRAEPRTRVRPGSVGIGAAQTGVYALPTPGGWNLIGRTTRRLFDPSAARDNDKGGDPFTLHVGDEVRFDAVAASAIADDVPAPAAESAPSEGPAIEVHEPGLLTSVQDLGRPGLGRFGVSPGGAADRGALLGGNRLVGNVPDAAVLEITLLGPRLRFVDLDQPRLAVLTGADRGAHHNGTPVAPSHPFVVRAGDELAFDPARADQSGVRAYLCVAGGFDVPVVFGSRATDLLAGFGGWHGRALREGDRVALGEALTPQPPLPCMGEGENCEGFVPLAPAGERGRAQRGGEGSPVTLRFVLGPQADRFAVAVFTGQPYTVTARSDRVGLRLQGAEVRAARGADVISEGMSTGSIQIAGDGQPIVMLPARATIGGYARIGTVIGADLDRLAQLPPGATVRFVEVPLAEARARTLAARRMLREDGGGPDPLAEEPPGMQADPTHQTDQTDQTGQPDERSDQGSVEADAARQILGGLPSSAATAWDPRGVRRIIRAVARYGIADFELRVESAGLYLRMGRGEAEPGVERMDDTSSSRSRQRQSQPLLGEAESGMGGAEPVGIDELGVDPSLATGDEATIVTAPMLGVFYHRSSPNEPLFAHAGETIAEGQTIGLIEVMKSFHEVPAPHAGTFDVYLADDGQSVEYGAPLARLYRPDAPQRD